MAKKNSRSDKTKKPVRTKKSGSKVFWIIYVAIVAVVLYIAVYVVEQHQKIQISKDQLSELNNSISLQKIKLNELKNVADAAEKNDYDSFADYIERIAREQMDYVKSGEVVYINIAGD
ncbi:MAG: septum formation initiator family protein [Clostridia bacterium]|nr:septum formation initiator family protein [Clostridia bacterium]